MENIKAPKNEVNFLDTIKDLDKAFIGITGLLGIAGFKFDLENETEIVLENMSSDHYLEDNNYVNENIALKPVIVTMSGEIGEIADRVEKVQSTLEKYTEKLTTIVSYLPVVTSTASKIMNNVGAFQGKEVGFDAYANLGEDLFKTYKDINIPNTRQQEVFLFFEALRNARTLFTVETYYRNYTNMAIQKIQFRQRKETKDVSEVVVTLKGMRYVEAKNAYKETSVTGRLKAQISGMVDKGKSALSEYTTSLSDYFSSDKVEVS